MVTWNKQGKAGKSQERYIHGDALNICKHKSLWQFKYYVMTYDFKFFNSKDGLFAKSLF